MKFSLWHMLRGWSLPEHTGISDDLDLLLSALEPAAGKHFITISSFGAGEAALALAAGGADRVVAYDMEDALMLRQMIVLKGAAASVLDQHEYLMLMGLCPAGKHQQDLFRRTLEQMSYDDFSFWEKRRRWFVPGLFFANRQTFFLQLFWLLIRLLAPKQACREMLFSASADKRSALFRRYISRPWLRYLFDRLGGHVNFFYPKAEWQFSEYPKVYSRNPFLYFENLFRTGLPENPLFAHYCLDDNEALPEALLPPHLRARTYDRLGAAGSRVQVLPHTDGGLHKMQLANRAYHGAYLSNIIDYLSPDDRTLLVQKISSALIPGAPVLVYSNESYDKIPPGFGLEPDRKAGTGLAKQDRAQVYTRIGLFRSAETLES